METWGVRGRWPQHVLTAEPADEIGQERAVASFLKQGKPSLGVVAYDDQATVVILRVADNLGWRVPQDLSVVGMSTATAAAAPAAPAGAAGDAGGAL